MFEAVVALFESVLLRKLVIETIQGVRSPEFVGVVLASIIDSGGSHIPQNPPIHSLYN
jgi:hypothetical protein